jgi:hypothetical protein
MMVLEFCLNDVKKDVKILLVNDVKKDVKILLVKDVKRDVKILLVGLVIWFSSLAWQHRVSRLAYWCCTP